MAFDKINEISELHFGARYTGFRDDSRFLEQTSDFDGGLIVWPGGTLAERSTDRYGLEYENLWNDTDFSRQPGLNELIEVAVASDRDLAIVLPTSQYQNEPEELSDHLWNLFETLLLDIGEENLPKTLILEIGNEYYANFSGADELEQAQNYTEILNLYGDILSEIETAYSGLPSNIKISYQAGRDEDINSEILNLLSADTLSNVDLISHHRFPARMEATDRKVDELAKILDDWREATEKDSIGIFLSSYNVASLTRGESFDFYTEKYGYVADDKDEELASRSNSEFEEFFQSQLGGRSVGLKHAEVLLSTFWSYTSLDVYAASVYGWDMHHGGRSSLNDTEGNPHIFAAGNIQDMMAESLIGTRPIDLSLTDQEFSANSESGLITSIFGFENEDKFILFIGNTSGAENEEISFDLGEFGVDGSRAWGERLTVEVDEEWRDKFNVVETPNVDQSNEALGFADGVREPFNLDFSKGMLNLNVPKDQIIRVSIAKTEEGVEDISSWQLGSGTDLIIPPEELISADGIELKDDNTEEETSIETDRHEVFDSLDIGISFFLSFAMLFLGIPVL